MILRLLVTCLFGSLVIPCLVGCVRHQKSPEPVAGSEQYQHIEWAMLTPPKWDAMQLLKVLNLNKLQDSDPKAAEAMKSIREQWQNAPVVEGMAERHINLIGYVAPLGGDLEHVSEFLLVPYFGACIHTPPPPSNQIVHVHLSGTPIAMMDWDAFVSVSGILEVNHTETALGVAGYEMSADIVKPFKNTLE